MRSSILKRFSLTIQLFYELIGIVIVNPTFFEDSKFRFCISHSPGDQGETWVPFRATPDSSARTVSLRDTQTPGLYVRGTEALLSRQAESDPGGGLRIP